MQEELKNKERIHLNDIEEGTKMREVKIYIHNGVEYWANATSKDQMATHADCESCGKEFEKPYTYSRLCFNCESVKRNEKFRSLDLVEWDGKAPLCIWDSDTFFFDGGSIEDYCEENETDIHSLKLVLCTEVNFRQVDLIGEVADDLHEDWEPDAELERLEKQINDYLKKTSTNSWIPTNKRVQL